MLQPRQLQDVQARYAPAIAEVRDFLLKAGIPVETPDALAQTAARLAADRAFRRDLTSTVWVVLDSARIGTPDLLGILALAAAGPHGASLASEDSAHTLLRFLMGARHSLEDAPAPTSAPASATPPRPVAPTHAEPTPAAPPTPIHRAPIAAPPRPQVPAPHALGTAPPRSLASALSIAMQHGHEPLASTPPPAPTPRPPAPPFAEPVFPTHTGSSRRAVFTSLPELDDDDDDTPRAVTAHPEPASHPQTPPADATPAASHEHAPAPAPALVPVITSDSNGAPEHADPAPLPSEATPGPALLAQPAAHPEQAASHPQPDENPAPEAFVPATTPALTFAAPAAPALDSETSLVEPDPVFLPARSTPGDDSDRRRARLAWSAAAACIAALLAGLWLLHADHAAAPAAPAPVVQGPATAPQPQSSTVPPPAATGLQGSTASSSGAAQPQVSAAHPSQSTFSRVWGSLRQHTRALAFSGTAHPPSAALDAPSSTARTGSPSPQPGFSPSSPAAQPYANSTGGAPIVRTAPQAASPGIVPSSVLSKRLDSPTVPANSVLQNELDAQGRQYPHLLRRKTGGALRENSGDEDYSAGLLATYMPSSPVSRTGNGSSVSAARSSGTAQATSRATVHSTVLGMMAGNVLYSPVPAYPSAASAAGVQGQVKIQATVDRDGNVSWARVVSGPPLLRDAALDAVQHWRYRPNLAAGKPAPATAEAVLDFELQ